MATLVRFMLHVVFPIMLGTIIYIGWRSPNLTVFQWIEYCEVQSLVRRPTLALPDWMLFSLPDGCWVYATTSWMLIIWRRMVAWVWIGVFLAVGGEFGQYVGLVQGTYSTLDVVFYLGAFVMAGVLNAKTPFVNHRLDCDGIPGVG